jgi:hypothetical protein
VIPADEHSFHQSSIPQQVIQPRNRNIINELHIQSQLRPPLQQPPTFAQKPGVAPVPFLGEQIGQPSGIQQDIDAEAEEERQRKQIKNQKKKEETQAK